MIGEVNVSEKITQIFRECQNTVPPLIQHLQALGNITTQKSRFEEALARQDYLRKTTGSSHFPLPPLGVISLFSSSTSDSIVAQHAADQSALVSAIFSMKQKWADRVGKAKKLMEVATEDTTPARNVSASGAGVDERSRSSNAVDANECFGLYGLLSALCKMESLLQEVVLAIRRDFQCVTKGGGGAFADALSALLVQSSCSSSSAGLAPLALHHTLESDALRHDGYYNKTPERLHFVDAIERLQSFLESQWEAYRHSFLNNYSLLLLAST